MLIEVAATKIENGQSPAEARQCRWQTKSPDLGTKHTHGGCLQPINQYRLIKTNAVVEVSGEEITTLEHATGSLTECPLIMIKQQKATQIDKKEGNQGSD